jgi:EAL domain-containing protein (putative c-di-GMP-specific phosphodiesterase class I)
MASNRLLVLDDEPASAAMIGRIARGCGFDTIITTDADDFRSRISGWAPTVIVLDLAMPEMDGHEVLSWLAQQGCIAKILIISGRSIVELREAEALGATLGLNVLGSLEKPLRVEPLRAAFREIYDSAGVLSVQDILLALQNREIRLVYQPKVDLRAGAVMGFEALARWDHPKRGPISPDTFIPVLEEHQIVDEFTARIFEMAFADANHWRGCGELGLAVNVSAANCRSMLLDNLLSEHCSRSHIKPDRISIEITETAVMSDLSRAADCLCRLHSLRVVLSIDDFGTGHSSLAKLQKLPFSELKIDRSFAVGRVADRQSGTLVRGIVDLAHNLGMKVVAEGVETEETMSRLREWNCDFAQGHLISRPMLPADVPHWLQSRNERGISRPAG